MDEETKQQFEEINRKLTEIYGIVNTCFACLEQLVRDNDKIKTIRLVTAKDLINKFKPEE